MFMIFDKMVVGTDYETLIEKPTNQSEIRVHKEEERNFIIH